MPATLAFSLTTLAELKRRLHRERSRLTAMAAAGRFDLHASTDDVDVSDLLDGDAPDGGSNDLERDRAKAVIAMADRGLVELDDAVDRLRRGAYGWCEECHDRIPLARLRTLPAAARCAPCQAGNAWPWRAAS